MLEVIKSGRESEPFTPDVAVALKVWEDGELNRNSVRSMSENDQNLKNDNTDSIDFWEISF